MERGATVISHHEKAKYYKCLLTLSDLNNLGSETSDISDATLDAALGSIECKPLCDVSVQAIDADAADVPDKDSLDAGADDDDFHSLEAVLPVRLSSYAAEQAQLRPFQNSAIAASYVHFDNCSHSSGLLRAYTVCPTHEKCTKHCQVVNQGGRRHAIAFCLAWSEWGKTLPRSAHSGRDKVPPNNLVAEFYAKLSEDD
jgi:hypothetical protein